MAALSIQVPYPVFYDRDGQPLDNGNIYIGVANLDPVTNPIQVYYDEALTIPASQPLKTSNGYVYRNGTPAQLYVNAANFSITVKNSKNTLVYNFPDGTGIPQADASAITFTGVKGQSGFVSDLGDADGSDWVGYVPPGLGAVARSAQDKMRDFINVKDFGAVGDGVANDTAAIQAALNTGKSIWFTCGENYRVTAPLTPTANGQVINLSGAMITLDGNFSGFEITGGLRNITICDGEIEGADMTGGYVIDIRTADRCTINNLRVYNPWNFLYVEEANLCSVENCWVNNIRGAYGVHWFGDNTKRSDILRLIGINLSSQGNAVGIMWDGNCNTLQVQAMSIVRPSIGVHVRNTSGGYLPLFGMFDDLEVDFPESHAVKLDAGEDFYFTPLLYLHGSVTGSGLFVGPAISQDRVVVTGGKITSHARYGIENTGIRVKVSNPIIFNNTLGNYADADKIYTSSPRFEVDTNSWFGFNAGNPIVNWDVNDVDGYIRSSNVRYIDINSISRFRVSDATNAIQIYVNGALKTVEVGAADSAGAGYRALRVLN